MKKLIFIVVFVFFTPVLEVWSYSVKPRMTKTIEPHYSPLSGRRYSSYDDSYEDPLIVNMEDFTGATSYIKPSDLETAEDKPLQETERGVNDS